VTDNEKVSGPPIVVADPSGRRFPVFPPNFTEELFEFGKRCELAAGEKWRVSDAPHARNAAAVR
jgi:hypothetical protein